MKGFEIFNKLTEEQKNNFIEELKHKHLSKEYEGIYEFIYSNSDFLTKKGTLYWDEVINYYKGNEGNYKPIKPTPPENTKM